MGSQDIYLVYGVYGEYSGYEHWNAAFYYDEGLAKSHAELAQARAREVLQKLTEDDCGYCYSYLADYCDQHKDLKNEWDAGWQGHADAQYSVEKITHGKLL